MPCITPGSGPTVRDDPDPSRFFALPEEGYRCQVVYDFGDVPRDEREWWLLQITSWLVDRGSVRDIAFSRPEEGSIRIDFGFASSTDCRRFRNRESHRLVVDGGRIVDLRVESRCDLSE